MKNVKPIPFNPDMAQLAREGIKTKTRRIMEVQPSDPNFKIWRVADTTGKKSLVDSLQWGILKDHTLISDHIYFTPKYQVGDIVYVKEAFYAYGVWRQEGKTKIRNMDKYVFKDFTFDGWEYKYLDNPPSRIQEKMVEGQFGWYRRSSLFMPKTAARTFLEVISVGYERLRDITEEDAIAEGVHKIGPTKQFDWNYYKNYNTTEDTFFLDPRDSFQSLWTSLYGENSWKKNPYVWVYEFKACERPQESTYNHA